MEPSYDDYLDRMCKHCGQSYGSHHAGTQPWPRDYCSGPDRQMDWENGPGTTFEEDEDAKA